MITDIKAWLDESAMMDAKPVPDSAALSIPVERIEEILDELTELNWSTTNYRSVLYQDENGELCCGASIEVNISIPYMSVNGVRQTSFRNLTGACNFKLSTLKARGNEHWNATAKSLCVVNALTDLGKRTGRWLNTSLHDLPTIQEKREVPLRKPDAPTRALYGKALIENDTGTKENLEKIYDFKI